MKKEEKAPVYVLCPRCELNYINKKDKVCTVCKAEMGLVDPSILIPDEEEVGVERLCPQCKVNYLDEGEDICFVCQKERDEKAAVSPEEWDFIGDAEEVVVEPEESADILEDLVLVGAADDEEEEDPELAEFAEKYKEPDDFDFDVSEDDFLADDEDEDEDEDDDLGDGFVS